MLKKLEKDFNAYQYLETIKFTRYLTNEFYSTKNLSNFSNARSKNILFEIYEKCYPNEKNLVKEFRESLKPSTSLYWYIEQPLIHRVLNSVCQRDYLNLTYKFQYFIQCLFIQLREEHSLFMKDFHRKSLIYVYRGQLMTTIEFKRLKMLIGRNILITNFLLTHFSKEKVLHYVDQCQPSSNEICFILKIIINPHLTNTQPYAPIYTNNQRQLLIMLGANYHILDIILNPHEDIPLVLLQLNNNQQF